MSHRYASAISTIYQTRGIKSNSKQGLTTVAPSDAGLAQGINYLRGYLVPEKKKLIIYLFLHIKFKKIK